MREIKYIVLHCTATSKDATVENIKKYWKERLGWKNVGYHFIIKPNGKIEKLAGINTITNGVRGFNDRSIHISYIGGKYEDDRTEYQIESQHFIVGILKDMFPKAKIQGHTDFPKVTKSCPRFDAIEEFKYLDK